MRRVLVAAHRFSFTSTVGPILAETLDHLCKNPACVNPAHLDPVSQAENNRRGASPLAAIARGNVCPNGHPYSPNNVRYVDFPSQTPHRRCVTCKNGNQRRYRKQLLEKMKRGAR